MRRLQKTSDLAREAVGYMHLLGAGALGVYKVDFLSFGGKFIAFIRIVVFSRILWLVWDTSHILFPHPIAPRSTAR
jgi:hypothetical protein